MIWYFYFYALFTGMMIFPLLFQQSHCRLLMLCWFYDMESVVTRIIWKLTWKEAPKAIEMLCEAKEKFRQSRSRESYTASTSSTGANNDDIDIIIFTRHHTLLPSSGFWCSNELGEFHRWLFPSSLFWCENLMKNHRRGKIDLLQHICCLLK